MTIARVMEDLATDLKPLSVPEFRKKKAENQYKDLKF